MISRMTPIALALSFAAVPFTASADATRNAAAEDEANLPTVNVSANAERSSDLPAPYAGGQVAKGARLGLLGNQDVMDTPFNVTSYTSELIENKQARTIGEVLLNDAAVRNTTSSGHPYENFRVRGFDVNQNDMAINGMFGMTPIGHTPVEMFERVEVQKGPGALFSGMAPGGAVGGVTNLVPKRATDDPLTRIGVGYQSQSQLGTTVDLGRRFGEKKEVGVRVNGSFSGGESERENQDKKREFISAALDYRGSSLKASLDAYHSKEIFKGGTAAMFWMSGPSIPNAPDSKINQFPSARGQVETNALIARGEYEINPHLSAFAGVGLADSDYSGFFNGTHVRNINASGTSTTTTVGVQRGYEKNLASEAGLRGQFRTGAVQHETVLQITNLEQETGSATASTIIPSTSIYSPTSWPMPATPASAPKTTENTWSSVALVDTLSMLEDKLRLTVGLRNQTVKTTNFSAVGAVTGAYDKSAVTPAVAVVVKPWGPAVSLYANYVEGLSQGDSVKKANGYAQDYTFEPYKTEQREVGVKWNAGTFSHTFSLFQIGKPVRISSGSAPNMIASDGGEKRVRGVEWNTFGEIVRNVRLLGGVAYSDGVQTKTSAGTNDGKEAVGVPHWQGTLGAEWDTPWLAGLTFNGRLTSTSSQYLDAANTMKLPGWSVLDFGVRHTTRVAGRTTVTRLTVNNVLDKHYYSGAFSDTTPIATLGLGRTVSASVTMDF